MAYAVIKRGSSGKGWFAIAKEDPPFFISVRQFAAWDLHENQELDEAEYRRILGLKRRDDCQEKALSLLAVREHTAWELKEKLLARKFSSAQIDEVLAQLREDGSLDEARYAESMIRSRQSRNPEGKALLLERLVAKGVPREEAAKAVNAAFAEHGEAYLRVAFENVGRTTPDRNKQIQKLLRKGFSYRDVKRLFS